MNTELECRICVGHQRDQWREAFERVNTDIVAVKSRAEAAEAASEKTLAIFENQRKRFGKCREDLKAEREINQIKSAAYQQQYDRLKAAEDDADHSQCEANKLARENDDLRAKLQAAEERIAELDLIIDTDNGMITDAMQTMNELKDKLQAAEAENKRLRDALEKIRDTQEGYSGTYHIDGVTLRIARAALEGK